MGENGMAEYRIDELARAAGTTSRNVRAYQERGLLPPPVRRIGRALIYDDSHLERLKIIDVLLQRGFTTAHIADFITGWETGKDLTEILGLQHAVTAAWGQPDETLQVPRELIDTFLGEEAADPEILARLAELGLARIGTETVEFTDPQLLENFAELHGYGFRLGRLADLQAAVSGRLDEIAHDMMAAAKEHIVDAHGPGWLPDTDDEIAETAKMLTHLRGLAVTAVNNTLARSLDRVLREELGDYLAEAVDRRAKEN
ncbi:MerR family transcriptional regulator [Nocardia aobensis]|uniref:MerR family transcriptional regulator n=1 Tax=Nocardia aobensis TaxID=257277 RepID=A0ABW6P1W5_9NOCA